MRTLVVACHPDDETLFAFDFISRNPGTHVAVCTIDRRKGKECRVEDFFRACAMLQAVPFVVAGDFEMWGIDTRPIEAFAASYDVIVTHNEVGEYGHPAHIKLHHAMRGLGKRLLCFNHGVTLGRPIDMAAKTKVLDCYHEDNRWLTVTRKVRLDHEELLDRSS